MATVMDCNEEKALSHIHSHSYSHSHSHSRSQSHTHRRSYSQGCTAVGDGGASPTTKVYEFWVFYHQSVQILFFLSPKRTNFGFF